MVRCKLKKSAFSWPDKCAACGAKATHTSESKCSAVTKVGYFILFATTTHQITSIKYPVCYKHKIIGMIAGKLSQRNLFNLAMGSVAFIFLYYICVAMVQIVTAGKAVLGNSFLMFATIYALAYFGLYLWAKNNTPVKINNATNSEIELSFNDDSYGKEFIAINISNIL